MARRRKSYFKQVSNVHIETLPDPPEWNSFLILDKIQDSMQYAYIDKVRISYVFDEPDDTLNGVRGLLFVASMDAELSATAENNDGQIISADARAGAGGVVNLPIKRRVTSNVPATDAARSRSGSPIYLHLRPSDIDEQTKVYLVVETWGTMFNATSL